MRREVKNGIMQLPIDSYDATYHLENKIKHLSFHAYLKKLQDANKVKAGMTIPLLEQPHYTVTSPCPSKSHQPWPKGICTKCQPSAITLQRQEFRMVDHVEFAEPALIDSFLTYWRKSGQQRLGFLLGRYEPYEAVPMGIKCVVEAIHEPPQEGMRDGLVLGWPWEDHERVVELAFKTGLELVGVLMSDLTQEGEIGTGKTQYKRHEQSFFLSSLEIVFAARLQRLNPYKTKFCAEGSFQSRFITCVLTGNKEGGIEVQAYQVSGQAMALDEADLVMPSTDPGQMLVKKEEDGRYVPEVFYRYKNEYGLAVQESAKPKFPVEYLLINLSHGFPNTLNPLFLSHAFPIENRPGLHDQNLQKLFKPIAEILDGSQGLGWDGTMVTSEDVTQDQFARLERLARMLSDWHLIAYVQSQGMLSDEEIDLIIQVAVSHEDTMPILQLIQSSGWQHLLVLARESQPLKPSTALGRDEAGFEIPPDHVMQSGSAPIACPHCTFENEPGTIDCVVCGLPLR